jgi:hypothetical protein
MKRPFMPLSVKLASALHALNLDGPVEWDHCPPLAMRPVDPETGDTIPPASDPHYIVPRSVEAHKAKTFGDGRPLSGDISQIAKTKRIEQDEAAFRAALLAKTPGQPREKRSRIPSRPFRRK